jgi:non-specific serine/threonine protein kinase
LAQRALALDLGSGNWSALPGPQPREHLGVVALEGRVYAVGGRSAGFDTNLAVVEVLDRGATRWRSLPAVPDARGGTGLAALPGRLVSVGGEETAGTIASAYLYDVERRRWRRLPDLPTPRHGLGVVAAGGAVYAIGGGPVPGLAVSAANERLRLE